MLTDSLSSPVSWQAGVSDAKDLHAEPGGAVEVDANLLFLGHYARDHADLVISDGHHAVRVRDYFGEGARPTLRTAEGGSLPESTIAGLVAAGTTLQVAETEGGEPRPESKPIGRVETAEGGASALRNGVSVTLRPGDPVYKGDVLQTDDSGHLAVAFIDGTAFNLDGESRMVVDGMTYQQGAAGNSALFSLVEGAITFVAGQTAKTGDMKVSTPTATMGIRGTAVHVEIASDRGTVKFSVMTEPDGHTGRYDVYANGDPEHVLFTVSDPGISTTVTPNGQGQLSVASVSKSATDMAREDALVKGVFATAASGQQRPIIQAPTEAPTFHPNTPTSSPAGGSSSPPNLILPDKGFAPPAAPAAPEQPANHTQADPTTTGSIVRAASTGVSSETASSVATTATLGAMIVSVAAAEAHGATITVAAPPAPVVTVSAVSPAPAGSVSTTVPSGTATFLGSGAPAPATGAGAQTAAGSAASASPAPSADAATASQILTAGGPLHAVATLGGPSVTMDLLTGVTGGERGATLSVADLTYALGQAAASQSLPAGIRLSGHSLTLDPSVLAARGVPGSASTVTVGFDISDGHGGTVHQSLIVTLASPNLGPVLAPDPAQHVVSEVPGVTGGTGFLTAGAALAFTDPNLGDTHHATVALSGVSWSAGPGFPAALPALLASAAHVSLTEADSSGAGHVSLAFAAPGKSFDFLAKDETLQATYTVSVTDAFGAVSTRPVTFTVVGTNDAPVFDQAPPAPVSITPAGLGPGLVQTSGSLHFIDPDLSDRPTASVLDQTATGYDAAGHTFALTAAQAGTLEQAFSVATTGTSTGTVAWSYTLADFALAFLSPGQSVKVVSTVLLDDHHGGTTTQDVTVNLTAPTGPATTLDAQPDIDGVARGETVFANAAHGLLSNDTAGGPGAGLSIVSATGAGGPQILLPTLPGLGSLPPIPVPGLPLPIKLGPLQTVIAGDYGTLTLASDGSYSYRADKAHPSGPDTILQDVFTYTTQDRQGHSASSTLTITVTDPGMDYLKPSDLNDGTAHILIGGNGRTVLDAGNGDDLLIAGHGPNVLIGGAGNDVLVGGSGPTTFIFNTGFGHDTVRQFDTDHDTLQFGHDVFATPADVLSHATDGAKGLTITAGADTLLLLDVTKQALADHLAALHIV